MAEHLYLKLDGIDGSSARKGHEKWVEILSYSHGISYSVSSGKDFSGAIDHSPLSIMKMADASSHALIQKLNRREQIKTITLEVWCDKGKEAGKVELAVKIELSNCRVSSYQMSGSDDGQVPVESIALAYQKIVWTFPNNKATDHDFTNPYHA